MRKLAGQTGAQIIQSLGVRKRLAQHGADAMKAQARIEDGPRQRWWRPVVSRRKAKIARKQAILNGTYGSFDLEAGGWLPEWDDMTEPRVLKPQKRHQRERSRAARALAIEQNMREMPGKIQAYKTEVEGRKPPPGIESLLKRLAKHK